MPDAPDQYRLWSVIIARTGTGGESKLTWRICSCYPVQTHLGAHRIPLPCPMCWFKEAIASGRKAKVH
jgi:hypothetical protein